jgi:hypothetical protein
VTFLLAGSDALAWSATGHMIAASIAYRALPAELRTKYVTILTAHPDYADWKRAYRGNVDEGAYLFMRAALWPDELKKDRRDPETHAEWHYINLPLVAPSFPIQDAPPAGPKGDIMTAIAVNREALVNWSSTAEQKAIALAWLIHLIGDIHQPLHTTALITDGYKAPRGDRGGNDFFIRPSETAKNAIALHAFWDGLLGTAKDFRRAGNEAIGIEREYGRPDLPELVTQRSVRDWMLESRAAAVTSVYLSGRLAGVNDRRLPAPVVPETYRSNSKRVAERRIALAGYRLADLLRGEPQVDAE